MRTTLNFAWRGVLAVFVGSMLASLAAPASAQNWVTLTCNSCHGDTPSIASNVTDGSGSTTLGLGEGWMGSQSDALDHVHTEGQAAIANSAAMRNVTAAQFASIYTYFLNLRDGAASTPPTQAFGSRAVGSPLQSGTFNFTVTNYRNTAMPYSFSIGAGSAPSTPGDFSIQLQSVGGTAGCTSSSIPAASGTGSTACTVNVRVTFNPQGSGSRNATLRVSLNGTNPTAFASSSGTLSGSAFVPTPVFSRTPASASPVTRVDTNTIAATTITNGPGASANLSITNLGFSLGVYTLDPTSECVIGTVLTPGNDCVLRVRFRPTTPGPFNGVVTISHNAAGSPGTFTLNGTGTRSVISPSSPPNRDMAFGATQLGVPRLISQAIGNVGDATLNFTVSPTSPAAKSGANPGDFGVGLVCAVGPPIPVGGNCTLNVTFTPAALGSRSATLTITSDAFNGPLIFNLTGSGVALPEPDVTTVTDFPDTVINENSALNRTFTITNTRVRAVTYSVASTTDFTILSESCAGRVVAGNNATPCDVVVRFRPQAAGGASRRTANLVFNFTGTLPDDNPDPITRAVAGNALLPLGQSSTSVNASAVVGTPTTSTTVLLTNRASTPITLSTLVFSGAAAGDYSFGPGNTCTPGRVIAASDFCSLIARFDPAAPGTRNATLTISHNAAGSPQTVAYLGTATPAPQGRIELGASALTFADTQLQSTSAQSVIVHNGGDLALNFSAFTFGGAMPAEFNRSGTCAIGTPLAIGADCTLTVTFAPAALGPRTAMLTIASDASNGAATLTLAGTGVPIPAPQVSLTPATLAFGTQTIGGLFPARRVRLVNSGTADLAVASVTVAGAGFTNVSAAACPATLVPNAGCDIDIAFMPVAAVAYTGTLTVTSNAAGSPHVAALTGTGTATALPVLVYTPATTSLEFGAVSAGSVSAVQTVTVSNQGPGGVNLTVLNAVGVDAASFSVVGGTCAIGATLFEGATCTVDIRFAPGSAGTKTATVQIASTGSFPPVLSLTGVGLAGPNPNFAVSAAAFAFESTRVGTESLPQTLRLTSSGSGVVTVTAMAVSGPYALQSTTCPAVPFSLPAGTECTVVVSFKPTGEGTSAGTLSITSDAAPAVRDVALSGNGEGEADVSGGGGCTIGGSGAGLLDPTLWLMLAAALMLLWRRRRALRPGRAGAAR